MSKTQEIIEETIKNIKIKIKNGSFISERDIIDYLRNCSLYKPEDIIQIYEEIEECDLSDVDTNAICIGEYNHFRYLLSESIDESLIKTIIDKLKEQDLYCF